MPDHGVELGADLYLLWRAGRDDLPTITDVFRTAATDLRRIQHDDPHWTVLQQELSSLFEGTSISTHQAAVALRRAVTGYAAADAAAHAELERLKRTCGDPVPHGVVRER